MARFGRMRPRALIVRRRDSLLPLTTELAAAAATKIRSVKQQLDRATTRLRLLSPQHTLDRGYSITTLFKKDGAEVIRDASQVQAGDRILTRVKNGSFQSTAGQNQ